MRSTLAVLGLAAAVSATAIDVQVAAGAAAGAKVGADVNAQVGAGVDAKVDVECSCRRQCRRNRLPRMLLSAPRPVQALLSVSRLVGAGVGVDAKLGAGESVEPKIGAGVDVGAKFGAGKNIDAQVSADVDAQVATISAKYRGGAAVNPGIHAGAGLDLVVNQAKMLVSVAVEHLLCVVGNVMKTLVATFDCHCK